MIIFIIWSRDDISGPMDADAFLGLTPAEIKRVTPIEHMQGKFLLKQSILPKKMGRKIEPNLFELVKAKKAQIERARERE